MRYNRILKVFCGLTLSCACSLAFADGSNDFTTDPTPIHVNLQLLFLQPYSNNLKYAVFVTGTQPYYQRWYNQSVNPAYSAAFQLGASYSLPQSEYDISADWLHLNSNDSAAKQASPVVSISGVEFVAPPYDVGPAVFGIKHASSSINFNFNSIDLDIGKTVNYGTHITARLFGGLNILRLSQTITTTFDDFAGSLASLTYPLPADPNYYFTTENTSQYLGAGPELGFNVQYVESHGFGIVGQLLGSLTAGTIKAHDSFTSASTRLIDLGINPSSQAIYAPNTTQVVPGIDGKLGLSYNYTRPHSFDINVELGYRLAYYLNAISEIQPANLVQTGVADAAVPEFSTGTMAIQSTSTSSNPFGLNGPYLSFTVSFA